MSTASRRWSRENPWPNRFLLLAIVLAVSGALLSAIESIHTEGQAAAAVADDPDPYICSPPDHAYYQSMALMGAIAVLFGGAGLAVALSLANGLRRRPLFTFDLLDRSMPWIVFACMAGLAAVMVDVERLRPVLFDGVVDAYSRSIGPDERYFLHTLPSWVWPLAVFVVVATTGVVITLVRRRRERVATGRRLHR